MRSLRSLCGGVPQHVPVGEERGVGRAADDAQTEWPERAVRDRAVAAPIARHQPRNRHRTRRQEQGTREIVEVGITDLLRGSVRHRAHRGPVVFHGLRVLSRTRPLVPERLQVGKWARDRRSGAVAAAGVVIDPAKSVFGALC